MASENDFVAAHLSGGYSSENGKRKPQEESQLRLKRHPEPAVDIMGTSTSRALCGQYEPLLRMDAYSRHRKFVDDYILHYGRKSLQDLRDSNFVKTDNDIIRENIEFIHQDAESWEKRLAKRYWDKLNKEYCIADMSKYKQGGIGLRWRTEQEVINGKGQFSCGNKRCSESGGLRSFELNFAYVEQDIKKNTLVKLRVCPECAYKLHYKKNKKLAKELRRPPEPILQSTEIRPSKRAHIAEDKAERSKAERSEKNEENEQAVAIKESKTRDVEKSIWTHVTEERTQEDEMDDYFQDILL